MTDERHDPEITDALSRLRVAVEVPPIDPAREQALLAAFDAHAARTQSKAGRWVFVSAAATLVIAVGLGALVVIQPPPDPPSATTLDLAEFVPWPGAEGWPPFESGTLIRVDLPVSALPGLGLWPAPTAGSLVPAEVVVGQDGLARLVRLVHQD